jgi:hypothetical protein
MNDPHDHPADSRLHRHKEYEDPHFHDDIEVVSDDGERPRLRPPQQREAVPRLPRRRHRED